jgi:putative ABC transport system permease protein
VFTKASIALRNLNRQKKRSFLLGGAIAFGILIVTMVGAFTEGMIQSVNENFAQLFSGHIFITGYEKSASGKTVNIARDDSAIVKAVRDSGAKIKSLSNGIAFSGSLIFEGESVQQYVNGVDWETEKALAGRIVVKEGSIQDVIATPNGIVISEPRVRKLGARLGDTIIAKLETPFGVQNVGDFTLKAIAADLGILGGTSAYANKEYVRSLMDIDPGDDTGVAVMLENAVTIDADGDRIYESIKNAGISVFPRASASDTVGQRAIRNEISNSTWEGTKYQLTTLTDHMAQMQSISTTLNTVALVVLLILLLIIMVGILNTFRMIMYERIREIGTMRALGMQRGGIRAIFLLEAMFLALGGALAGIILAAALMFVFSLFNFGLTSVLSMFLTNGHFVFRLRPQSLVGYIAIVAVMALLAALVPAGKAAKLDPAHALRTHY